MFYPIKRFFLMCSGATLSVLEQPECKTELTRYAMMGAFVVFTAAFAALSGGYALYTGFKTIILAIPVGLLWGAFIFNLDRFIVSSIRKKPLGKHLSFIEKALIKSGELMTAVPRLILAAFIAITVAVPLEMKYFEPEIKAQIAKTNLDAAKLVAGEAIKGIPEIAILEKELTGLEDTEKNLRERRDLLRDQQFYEGAGVQGQGLTGIRGEGPEFKRRAEEAKRIEEDLKEIGPKNTPRKEYIRERLNTLRAELNERIKNTRATIESGDGFLARFKALSQVADEGPVKNLTLFLVLLLILVETAPVLIKLLAGRGPYDDALEAIEHKIYISKQKEISDFNSEINMELEFQAKNQSRWKIEEELLQGTLNLQTMQNLAAQDKGDAETEIAKATIKAWKWKQLQRINNAYSAPLNSAAQAGADANANNHQ